MKPCGTEAAYYRHRGRGEEPCPEDREAVAEANRKRRRAKGVRPFTPARHGTHSKYVAGCRCGACRGAHAAYQAKFRNGGTRRERWAWKLADQVKDWLMLDGGWLTADGLALECDANPESVERVLRRLRNEGVVESRVVELAGQRRREQRLEWRIV